MNRLKTISIAAFLFIAGSGFCQVPADSLPGTYAGKCYYASPATNPWTITQDTVFVISIDTINCSALISGGQFGCTTGSNFTFYSSYYSCSPLSNCGKFPNCCDKFYSLDSLCLLCDNVTPPPPNPSSSTRFYGKRISNKITGIEQITGDNEKIFAYPNPVNGKFTILIEDSKKQMTNVGIEIYNVLREKVYSMANCKLQRTIEIDISSQPEGIYFLQIITQQGIVIKKIIIKH